MRNIPFILTAMLLFVLSYVFVYAPEALIPGGDQMNSNRSRALTKMYVDSYRNNTDMMALKPFYSDKVVLEDIHRDTMLMGWQQVHNYWGDTIAVEGQQHISIRTIIAEEQYGLIRGVYIPYQRGLQKNIGMVMFCTWLEWDLEQELIVYQTDYINYPKN
ncbi:MAG: hypothetical protein GY810_07590 [Aureispira sp.]|nr:hypothetical protein [Aureispira sp.]